MSAPSPALLKPNAHPSVITVILLYRPHAGAVVSDLEAVVWYEADMELAGGKLLVAQVSCAPSHISLLAAVYGLATGSMGCRVETCTASLPSNWAFLHPSASSV